MARLCTKRFPWLAVVWIVSLPCLSVSFKLGANNASSLIDMQEVLKTNSSLFLKSATEMIDYGQLVALWNHAWRRYVGMNAHSKDMYPSPEKGVTELPFGWTWQRFAVVDAGNGEVALHNIISNRFVGLWGDNAGTSPPEAPTKFHANWGAEKFKVVDAGGGQVAFHSAANNRFLSLRDVDVYGSPVQGVNSLPESWAWQKFYAVRAKSYLIPGTEVSLYNEVSQRFLQMSYGNIVGSNVYVNKHLPAGYTWERFTVVKAPNGAVALHNKFHNRYLSMDSHGTMYGQHHGLPLPDGWWHQWWVPLPTNPAKEEIALWSPNNNRFFGLAPDGKVTSTPHMSPQDFPVGWTHQRFIVVQVG